VPRLHSCIHYRNDFIEKRIGDARECDDILREGRNHRRELGRQSSLTSTKNSTTVEKACIHIAILPSPVIASSRCKMKFVLT